MLLLLRKKLFGDDDKVNCLADDDAQPDETAEPKLCSRLAE